MPAQLWMMHAGGKRDFRVRDLLVLHLAEQVVNAIEPGLFLVDRMHHPPGRFGDVGAVQHLSLALGSPPMPARLQIHGTEFPLLQRVVRAAEKPKFLLLVGDGKPVFDQLDT